MFHKLVLNPEVGNKILKMKWWIYDFSRTNRELLLSDRPCMIFDNIDHPNCVIALPISPTKAFMTTQSETLSALMRAADATELAERLNEQSLLRARARIYARSEKPKRFILNRMRLRNS